MHSDVPLPAACKLLYRYRFTAQHRAHDLIQVILKMFTNGRFTNKTAILGHNVFRPILRYIPPKAAGLATLASSV